jgi:hypothetical protein
MPRRALPTEERSTGLGCRHNRFLGTPRARDFLDLVHRRYDHADRISRRAENPLREVTEVFMACHATPSSRNLSTPSKSSGARSGMNDHPGHGQVFINPGSTGVGRARPPVAAQGTSAMSIAKDRASHLEFSFLSLSPRWCAGQPGYRAENREWERRGFSSFSNTEYHLVTCLKHLPRTRKPNSPLHLRREFPPQSGRGTTK